MVKVEVVNPKTKEKYVFYMDGLYKKDLDRIKKKVLRKDSDYVLVFDGLEGSGKTTIAIQTAIYLDPTMDLDRICFTPEEFSRAIVKASKGQCVIYDEAYTGLASRTALSEINHLLVSQMMEMRQKNLFVFVCIPTFYLLDKYVALWRARGLVHIYEMKGKRGYFRIYNRKKKRLLYLNPKGKRDYSYSHIRTKRKGRFLEGYIINEGKYREKKRKALERREKRGIVDKFKQQRDIILLIMNKELKQKQVKILQLLKKYKIRLAKSTLSDILADLKERV